ncbi:MAG: hypothetical protein SAK29_21950 [Scytonema sp. PMC 1069.18]|nr:hypothetical protein [Scytonema sp. PMC 1069.18]MEC4887186.1 hypothetical protein [Scytonema sp. PMC 1070.18]
MNPDSDIKLIGVNLCKIELLQGTQVAIQQIQQVFSEAEWAFQSNGSFTFTTAQTALPKSFFPITGTFTRSGSCINFQGEHHVGFQESSSASIDGRVELSGEAPVVEAIYTLTWQRNTRQIAHIVQTLEQTISTPQVLVEVLSSSSISNQPEEVVLPLEEDNLDIQLPAIQRRYTGCITGETETGAFAELPIQIFIDFNQESEPPIFVNLLSDPQVLTHHGGIRWNFDHSQAVESNCQISGNAQQFLLEVDSPEGNLDVGWYTLPSSSAFEAIGVVSQRVRLSVSMNGDRITGEIEGSGFYTPPSSSEIYPTTYRASLSGEQVQSRLVKRLENVLKTSPFTGSWQNDKSSWGQITLTQEGQNVTGIYTNSEQGQHGIIHGTCQENRLDFTWTNNQQQGSGFFRAIAGAKT